MEGVLRNTTVKRLSRRRNGYEPLDEPVKSSIAKVHKSRRHPAAEIDVVGSKKVTSDFPLWTREDEAKKRRQLFINSYKFETADESQRSSCSRKLNEVASKVKTSVAKLVLSFSGFGSLRSCNCRLPIQASSPTPRIE